MGFPAAGKVTTTQEASRASGCTRGGRRKRKGEWGRTSEGERNLEKGRVFFRKVKGEDDTNLEDHPKSPYVRKYITFPTVGSSSPLSSLFRKKQMRRALAEAP